MSKVVSGCGRARLSLSQQEELDLQLFETILNNDRVQVRLLFSHHKRNINDAFLVVSKRKFEHSRPLHMAARCGHEMMLKFFLELGADVNLQGFKRKRTPLHMAVLGNHVRCVQVLLAAHAQLDARDLFGNTPCQYAAELGYHEVLDTMLRMGAHANFQDITGKTPLMKAARNNRIVCVQRLLRTTPNCSVVDQNNETALHFAARRGAVQIVRDLLAARCPPNTKNCFGCTPLMEAICNGHFDVVQVLLQNNADINIRDENCCDSPLEFAVRKESCQVIEAMLKSVLTSVTLTLKTLRGYDWDFHEFTRLLNDCRNDGRRCTTLFQLALELQAIPVCQLLAMLGYADQRSWSDLRRLVENNVADPSVEAGVSLISKLMRGESFTLQHACRVRIRKSLRTNLHAKISVLPLPSALKDYLRLKEELIRVEKEFSSCS